MSTIQFIGERMEAEATYVGEGPAPTSISSTVTFSGVPFGADEPGRVVGMVVFWSGASTSLFLVPGSTIGGQPAAIAVQTVVEGALSTGTYTGIIAAANVSGASGAVSLTFAGGVSTAELHVYNIVGLVFPTAEDTASASQPANVSPSISVSLDVQEGGVVLHGVMGRNSGNPWTIVGVNEDFDELYFASDQIRKAGGHLNVSADQAGRTITASSGIEASCISVAASFR